MNYNSKIQEFISASIESKKMILSDLNFINTMESVALAIVNAYRNGNKTLIAGNGGSAGDAQHIAAELVSRFYLNRPGLSSIALSTDSSIITAIANDFGYDKVFSKQIKAYGTPGDVFIGISTSGNSQNVINAIEECKKMGIYTVAFTGENGGKMAEISDISFKVPSKDTPRIQESHIMIGHILCYIIEHELFSKDNE
jgi:D-sedoheptulose 7-phosphate isomerase